MGNLFFIGFTKGVIKPLSLPWALLFQTGWFYSGLHINCKDWANIDQLNSKFIFENVKMDQREVVLIFKTYNHSKKYVINRSMKVCQK